MGCSLAASLMTVVIFPGIHDSGLTFRFLAELRATRPAIPKAACFASSVVENPLIFPAGQVPVYSVVHTLEFLQHHCQRQSPLVLICFSAGVVGGAGAAWAWQQAGGNLRAFIACDGWGVPLYGDFPIHRLSHDYFTHWSSRLLGAGSDSFYAEPPTEHLDLWRSPRRTQGWWVQQGGRQRLAAAGFINLLLQRYGESV